MKLTQKIIIIVCFTLLFFIGCETAKVHNDSVKAVAHRGGAALQLENTIEAFENALLHKIDVIEFDLHLSKDGVLIVHHDPVVVDSNGKKVPIRNLESSYIESLVIGNNQHIPTLREVLMLIQEKSSYPVILFVEIKVDERNMRYPNIEEKVLSILDEFAMIKYSHILSFDFQTLVTIKNMDDTIDTSALISKGYMSRLTSKDVSEIVNDMLRLNVSSVGIKDVYLTAPLVEALHKENTLVSVWTVNTASKIKKSINLGVDFITSDNPVLVKEIIGK